MPMDPQGHDLTRLALALHVARAYEKADSAGPESESVSGCRPRAVPLGEEVLTYWTRF